MLGVVVCKGEAFFGDAVDVGGFVAHHAAVVVADVPCADVIAPDDEEVGFFVGGWCAGDQGRGEEGGGPRSWV